MKLLTAIRGQAFRWIADRRQRDTSRTKTKSCHVPSRLMSVDNGSAAGTSERPQLVNLRRRETEKTLPLNGRQAHCPASILMARREHNLHRAKGAAVVNERIRWPEALMMCVLLAALVVVIVVVPRWLYPPLSASDLQGIASPQVRIQLQQAQSHLADDVRSSSCRPSPDCWWYSARSPRGDRFISAGKGRSLTGSAGPSTNWAARSRTSASVPCTRSNALPGTPQPTAITFSTPVLGAYIRTRMPWPGSAPGEGAFRANCRWCLGGGVAPDPEAGPPCRSRSSAAASGPAKKLASSARITSPNYGTTVGCLHQPTSTVVCIRLDEGARARYPGGNGCSGTPPPIARRADHLLVPGRPAKHCAAPLARLNGAKLRYANLARAVLEGVWLEGSDLTASDLRRAFLVGTRFRGANLSRAHLQGANLRRADLSNAGLQGANLADAIPRWRPPEGRTSR